MPDHPTHRDIQKIADGAPGSGLLRRQAYCGDSIPIAANSAARPPRIFGKNAKTEPAVEGRSGADMIAKQVVHGIANAIAQIVAEVPHTVQPGDEGVAVA
jgi:hypothetical protein